MRVGLCPVWSLHCSVWVWWQKAVCVLFPVGKGTAARWYWRMCWTLHGLQRVRRCQGTIRSVWAWMAHKIVYRVLSRIYYNSIKTLCYKIISIVFIAHFVSHIFSYKTPCSLECYAFLHQDFAQYIIIFFFSIDK